MNCPQCNELVSPTDKFCEGCGVNLIPNPSPQAMGHNSCQKCGATANRIDEDRYCTACGFRQVAIEHDTILLQPVPNLAGASDRGRRHHQNEDAMALKSIDAQTYILVVCDGVSSSQHPELASAAAASACIAGIEAAMRQQPNAEAAIYDGVNAALQAVAGIPFDPRDSTDPSSATIVAAIVRDRVATIGWLGDSRAYWLAAEKSLQLTLDDSWVNESVAAGEMTLAEAENSPHAHAITRWLGVDTLDDGIPSIATFAIPGAGYLLLCTDGLWNYAPEPSYLYHLIQQAPSQDCLDIARHSIRYANQQGGQDNITVGILAFSAQKGEIKEKAEI